VVGADGRIQGKGEAWFSERFTRSLIKPGFLRPIARLVGFKRLKSRYTVVGTTQRAKLDMSITDSLLWKFVVKKQVPKPLQRLATGEVPLWSVDQPQRGQVAKR